MAARKPTTTADLAAPPVEDATPGYVRVKSPAGYVTEVPESIAQALLDSGYLKA